VVQFHPTGCAGGVGDGTDATIGKPELQPPLRRCPSEVEHDIEVQLERTVRVAGAPVLQKAWHVAVPPAQAHFHELALSG
jgi:hypothetical protein